MRVSGGELSESLHAQVPYHCPVYTEVTPLGAATGEQVGMLPLGPFILKL